MLSSSDDFSVETPDETAGKDTEFSLVVSLEINKLLIAYKATINHNYGSTFYRFD